jgi:hypothetical protein
VLAGEGTWRKPLGLQMPGSFVMQTGRPDSPRDDAATDKQDYARRIGASVRRADTTISNSGSRGRHAS